MSKGIDVSAHQGNINWDAVKASGIDFAIIRISYGQNSVDSKAIRNIEECIRVGMPFGVYTYSYALNINNAINEANLVIKTLAPYKDKVKFPVIIDMEDADGYKRKHGMPSNDVLVSICEKECLMFEEAGYYAAIYASKSWFDTKLNSSRLNRFDKWIAWWNKGASFDKNIYGLWQYTSSGSVNGISGNVDMNYLYENNKIDYTLEWQKVMNKTYNCNLEEDGIFGPICKSMALKHYLYYKSPIISNTHVLFIQKLFNLQGYKLAEDSMFGPKCKEAAINFQKKNNLTVDGCVGPEVTKILLD